MYVQRGNGAEDMTINARPIIAVNFAKNLALFLSLPVRRTPTISNSAPENNEAPLAM